MNFTLGRNHTLISVLGHAIEFKKGEPTHVPKELYAAVQAIGAVPEDEITETKVADSKEPADPAERKSAIFAGFEQLILAGKRESFTGTGVPHVKALAAQIGFIVDGHERDELWLEYKTKPDGE